MALRTGGHLCVDFKPGGGCTDVHMRNELAAFGGRPAVTTVPPTQWPSVSKEEILAVVGLLVNNTISIYDRSYPIDALEDSFAAYIGRRYAIAFNSGTAALFAAYYA